VAAGAEKNAFKKPKNKLKGNPSVCEQSGLATCFLLRDLSGAGWEASSIGFQPAFAGTQE
jgi:hypothetical protein